MLNVIQPILVTGYNRMTLPPTMALSFGYEQMLPKLSPLMTK